MERESTIIKKWMADGAEAEALRRQRVVLLQAAQRLKDPVPDSIRRAIEGTNDVAVLERWFGAALDARNITALRRAMAVEE